jgi:hypothetical protein
MIISNFKSPSMVRSSLSTADKALKKQVYELQKQKTTLEQHIACAEVLYDKGDHMKGLISCLANMREWAAVPGEDLTVDGDLKLEMTGSEYAGHLEIQPKCALEKIGVW